MRFIRPAKLFRRLSSSVPPPASDTTPPHDCSDPSPRRRRLPKSRSLPRLRRTPPSADPEVALSVINTQKSLDSQHPLPVHQDEEEEEEDDTLAAGRLDGVGEKEPVLSERELESDDLKSERDLPFLWVHAATPDAVAQVNDVEPPAPGAEGRDTSELARNETLERSASIERVQKTSTCTVTDSERFTHELVDTVAAESSETSSIDQLVRPPSIVDRANANLINTLLESPARSDSNPFPGTSDLLSLSHSLPPVTAAMVQRKIWVKRPGASATLVQIREDDLVDDVREMILRKYANSLGKTFDAPDMVLSITSRPEQGSLPRDDVLGPEEEMCRTLDAYYPGGQTVDEALLINVPQRRTPKPSPRAYAAQQYQALDDYRPHENGTDYFPPMPAFIPSTIPQTSGSHDSRTSQHHHSSIAVPGENHPRSISVLNTGQIAPLPSPGATGRRYHNQHRPKYHRQSTTSPTIMAHADTSAAPVNPSSAVDPALPRIPHRQSTRPRMDSAASTHPNGIAPIPPPLPTPPAPEAGPTNRHNSNPPTPSGIINNAYNMTLQPPHKRPRKPRRITPESKTSSRSRGRNEPSTGLSISSALESAAVPPINVLIVEDNVINLKILEGLMKRLKVRWQTAMNGQIAVDKYKAGGFHLVLMDIQMPVMNGLQATKEIRRLERVNGIGVFGEVVMPLGKKRQSSDGTNGDGGHAHDHGTQAKNDADKLATGEGLFKSPVIIVALTASSLQSDRHEALAAGCNDFLTKPVNFVWLERKVKEWGCMQALIDYDGWKRWKDYADEQEAGKTEEEKQKAREKAEKDRIKADKMAKLQEKQAKLKEEREKKKRSSLNPSGVVETVNEEGDDERSQQHGASATNGDGPASNAATEALRTGAQCLKDANIELH